MTIAQREMAALCGCIKPVSEQQGPLFRKGLKKLRYIFSLDGLSDMTHKASKFKGIFSLIDADENLK
jgi:hypothetical protein